MSRLQNRIEQMEDLRNQVLATETEAVTKSSFISILNYHIKLLKEVDSLVDAFDKDDVQAVQDWYNKRK
jgi:hypothetical protein